MSEARQVTIELRRPPFWSPGLAVFLMVVGLVALAMIAGALEALKQGATDSALLHAVVAMSLFGGVAGVVLGRRLLVRTRPLHPIVFHPSHITLPRGVESLRSRDVAYRDILSVGTRGDPPQMALLIETRSDVFHFPFTAFLSGDSFELMATELAGRVLAQPEAQKMVEQAERRRVLAIQALSQRPLVTHALLALIVVVFANQYLTSGSETVLGPIRWGANVPALVSSGEWFRLLAANFLHGGVLHLGLNALGLFYLGSVMERFLGWPRFLIIYLASGLVASAASAYMAPGLLSVGASGALLGLFGALAVVNWRYGAELPLGIRQPRSWWVLIVGINVLLLIVTNAVGPALIGGQIDNAAHVGGLVCGSFLALVLLPPRNLLRVSPPASPLLYALACGLVALYVFGLGKAVLYAARFDDEVKQRVITTIASDPRTDADFLNVVAWVTAIDSHRTADEIRAIEPAARRAVARQPGITAYRDTLATVLYRLAQLEEAITLEAAALEDEPTAEYATQLARFLAARPAAGVVWHGIEAQPIGLHLATDRVTLTLARPLERPVRLYALLLQGERKAGLLRVRLQKGASGTDEYALAPALPNWADPQRLTVKLAQVEVTTSAPKSERPEWQFWPTDASIESLP